MQKEYFFKLSTYLKSRFGEKVWKISVDAGFTCPNRDGKKGTDGCIYCSVDSFAGSEGGDIAGQVSRRIEKLKRRGVNRYILYFQSYSNTYASTDEIKARIEQGLGDDGIVSLHIGTRPDEIDREKLKYLKTLAERYEVVLEYGLQSASDATLERINRGHTVKDFEDAVKLTHEYGIKTCAHIIFGLPGDTREDMLRSVRLVNSLKMHSVKFHHLHVVKDTKLAEMYAAGEVSLLSEEEYTDVLSDALGLLREETVVSRIVGDAAGDTLIAPNWPQNKNIFEKKLTDLMEQKGIVQGSLSDQAV